MHRAAKIKPVVIDESLVDLESLLLSREMGYSGVALKACKGHSGALVDGGGRAEIRHVPLRAGPDLPWRLFLQSASLAARIPGVAAIEGNARQYCPSGNRAWADRFPTMFHITDGTVGTSQHWMARALGINLPFAQQSSFKQHLSWRPVRVRLGENFGFTTRLELENRLLGSPHRIWVGMGFDRHFETSSLAGGQVATRPSRFLERLHVREIDAGLQARHVAVGGRLLLLPNSEARGQLVFVELKAYTVFARAGWQQGPRIAGRIGKRSKYMTMLLVPRVSGP